MKGKILFVAETLVRAAIVVAVGIGAVWLVLNVVPFVLTIVIGLIMLVSIVAVIIVVGIAVDDLFQKAKAKLW